MTSLKAIFQATVPNTLHGVRLLIAVALALWIAFALELDAPYWAGTTAALVCQPSLGGTWRKGSFRVLGTFIGASVAIVLVALFPQNRYGFLIGLALWGGVCSLVASLVDNYASYGAALAGYTSAIVASTAATAPEQVFLAAMHRAADVSIGTLCATAVLVAAGPGHARSDIVGRIATLAASLTAYLGAAASGIPRRDNATSVYQEIAALERPIDTALSETHDRHGVRVALCAATDGLLLAAATWQVLLHSPEILNSSLPDMSVWRSSFAGAPIDAARWRAAPAICGASCRAIAYELLRLRTVSPLERVLLDSHATGLLALARVGSALELTAHEEKAGPRQPRPNVGELRDLQTPLVNGLRAFVVIGVTEVAWVLSQWPNGPTAVIFAFVGTALLGPQGEGARAAARGLAIGTTLSVLLAAITNFALLPTRHDFIGLIFVLALVLVPLGAGAVRPRTSATLTPAAATFIPALSPTNVMTYDTWSFLNTGLAIISGCIIAAIGFELLPPPPAAWRVRRLHAVTVRELCTMVINGKHVSGWGLRASRRLAVFPMQGASPSRKAMVASLIAGSALNALLRAANGRGVGLKVRTSMAVLREGNRRSAACTLRTLADELGSSANSASRSAQRVRGAAYILADQLGSSGQPTPPI